MLVALVLIATSVMPLVAEARGGSLAAYTHLLHGIGHGEHDDDHGPEGSGSADLVHHTQSHVQILAFAYPTNMPKSVNAAEVRFQAVHDRAQGIRQGKAPFEPPRG
ncbi:hypothetical protein [Methylobacterium goesingense]|uniref:Cobalt transporter n=1 Tax=Methylobacterium goesingense TaxID=243690 RepID=A0ABV2LBS7_9HYPH|nr:hypothetical protein [Methylobacterium goesingense]